MKKGWKDLSPYKQQIIQIFLFFYNTLFRFSGTFEYTPKTKKRIKCEFNFFSAVRTTQRVIIVHTDGISGDGWDLEVEFEYIQIMRWRWKGETVDRQWRRR